MVAVAGSGSGSGFGVDSFVNSGGSVSSLNKDYDLPKPQEAPSFKPVDIMISKPDSNTNQRTKKLYCLCCINSQTGKILQ